MSRALSVAAAVIWAGSLVTFLVTDWEPDDFTIALAMLGAFVSSFTRAVD